MGWLWFLLIAAGVVIGYFWVRKNFKNEIERFRQIRRANRDD
ncbi:hypothetical protein GCM10027449_23360 [Sinomonas notoginsengisoli]|nr:hypothetical protein [Sinomonas notoginsengisoli]